MELYLTSKLREYNMGFLITGQEDLEIPAATSSYTYQGSCSSDCLTKKLKGNIYVDSVNVHMHYLGKSNNNKW